MTAGRRSKTLAAWIALAGGALGLHRWYLHGLRDPLMWLHLPPTALGLVGVWRLESFGQDDRLAWLLIPLLGLMISQAMLVAIVYALTPDARWDARHNHGQPGHGTGWAPILAAIAALMIGGIVLMGTIAYGVQKFFEWQLQPAKGSATGAGPPRSRTEATALSRVGQPLVCSDQTGPVECERR